MCAEHRDDIEEQLTAYLDGQLDERQAAELERRLKDDAELRRLLEELAATAEWVGDLPREPCPPGLRESTVAVLERDMLLGPAGGQGPGLSGRPRRVLRWLATAAVVALASTAGYFTLNQVRSGSSDMEDGSGLGPIVQLDQEEMLPEMAPAEAHKQAPEPVAKRHRKKGGPAERGGKGGVAGRQFAAPAMPPPERALRTKGPAQVAGEPAAERGQVPEAEMTVAGADEEGRIVRLRSLENLAPSGQPQAGEKQTVVTAVPRPSLTALEPFDGRWEHAAGKDAPTAHPVRVDVQVGSAARMYAMAGRARAFAVADDLDVLEPGALEEGKAAKKTPPLAAPGLEPSVGDKAKAKPSKVPAARPEARRLVFRGRRSQLLRLLGELRVQDAAADVQLVAADNSVHRGWEQVAVAAGEIGGIGVRGAGLSLPDLVSPPLSLGERRTADRGATEKKGRPLRVEGAAKLRGKGPAAPPQGEAKTEGERLVRALSAPEAELDSAVGYEVQPETAGRKVGARQNAGKTAAQPAAGFTVEPPQQQEESAGWVDHLLGLLRQADAALDPDPLVEVILHVRAAPATTAPAPAEFEPAPNLRIDRPRGATPDKPPALRIDRPEKD